MDKKIIILGMVLGSAIGGYVPVIFGANVLSLSSIICGAIGGILGIWLSFRLLN